MQQSWLIFWLKYLLFALFQASCRQPDRSTRSKSQYSCVQRDFRIMSCYLCRRLHLPWRVARIESDSIRWIVRCKDDSILIPCHACINRVFLSSEFRFMNASIISWLVYCWEQESIKSWILKGKCYFNGAMMMCQFLCWKRSMRLKTRWMRPSIVCKKIFTLIQSQLVFFWNSRQSNYILIYLGKNDDCNWN